MITPSRPTVPFALGLAGLIPFWGLALALVTGQTFGADAAAASFALAAYAATILAFLGGIRWGLAVASSRQTPLRLDYVVSVLPQLLGWAALALPGRWRLLALAALILATGPLDWALVARGLAPPWFGRLRMMLSVGAGAALVVAGIV